jgi:anti-sigma B factor antagonist
MFGMLKFTTKESSGVMVVAFEASEDKAGDWQSTQRDWLYKLIESRQDPRFALDLSDVNYLASSEIGFLMTVKRRIDRRQGKMVMFGIGAYLHDILRTMNLTKIIDIVEDENAAVSKLAGTPQS